MKDLEYADAVDPVGISTWDDALPGLAQFKRRGGKLLTYHGSQDPVGPTLLIERPRSMWCIIDVDFRDHASIADTLRTVKAVL